MALRRRMKLLIRTKFVLCALLLGVLVPAAGAHGGLMEVPQFEMIPSTTQAGAHPNMEIYMRFCHPGLLQVTNATNTSPIEITTAQDHNLISGSQPVVIQRVKGNTAANIVWTQSQVVVTGPKTFTLTGSAGNGPYLGGGDVATPSDPAGKFNCSGAVPGKPEPRVRNFSLHLPPGMLGNPLATPPCPTDVWESHSCDPSIYGLGHAFNAAINPLPVPTPVLNIATQGLEPARLGTSNTTSTPPGPFPILIRLRTTSDFGIDSSLGSIPFTFGGTQGQLMFIDTLLCAAAPCVATRPDDPLSVVPVAGAQPFFVNPTSCKPATLGVDVTGWGTSNTATASSAFTPTGCEDVPFDPTVTVESDNSQAGASAGITVTIQYPPYKNADIWQSQLRDADVTLPEGVSLAAAGGVGLESCSADQFGKGNDLPVRCPAGSEIGDLKVTTPVLAGDISDPPITGKAFFGPTPGAGRPTPAKPWKLFLLLEGKGLRIKLSGDVSVGEDGRVRTFFDDQPEVPFDTFQLSLKPGPNAPLKMPDDCDTHEGDVTLTGWSGASKHIAPTITATGCTDPRPFSPQVVAADAIPTQAGAHSISHLLVTRQDGEENIKNLNLSLPAGATGSLADAPLCPAAKAKVGQCGDDSKVGNIKTTVGFGGATLTAPGSLYLGEATQPGDAASFIIQVPTKVGPIDLGTVVVVNRVRLRPNDTGVDVISGDVPKIFGGVPLPIKQIEITVDRDDFFINPTSCATHNFVATFKSWETGQTSVDTFPTTPTGCQNVPFDPKLTMTAGARGATKPNAHTPLRAVVTQRNGESAISQARVVVPDILRPFVPFFQRPGALCNDQQLATRTCPKLSQVGTAKVRTPLLPFGLSGPVYIVLSSGSPLPSLAVFLRGGGFEVLLHASNGFQGIKILNIFDPVPDVPQSYFELNINGGPNGILLAHSDLCSTRPLPTVDTTFKGHSGKTVSSKPRLRVKGCGKVRASILGRTLKMSKRGTVKVKVHCRVTGDAPKRCKGRVKLAARKGKKTLGSKRYTVRSGKTKAVKIKLKSSGRKSVLRANKLRARATLTVKGGKSKRKSVRIKQPHRR
jgi:hypothetical protein